jgi:hypothetical protein
VNDTRLILEAEGKRRTCAFANAILFVQTEKWVEGKRRWLRREPGEWIYGPEHSRAMLEIEVEVDEDSGADGAAAPNLRIFLNPSDWRAEGVEAFANSKWHHGRGCEIEAFYGNDAPVIDNCVVIFGGWSQLSVIEIDWRGTMRCRPGDPEKAFHLHGPVRFEHISINVKRTEDVATIFATALPGFALDRLGSAKVEQFDYGEAMPANRRIWLSHTWALSSP